MAITRSAGGQLCWCTRRRKIDGKKSLRQTTEISRRAYGESHYHWLSFQWAIFDPSRNELKVVSIGKGDKFHWENPNFEVQIALVQEIWPFLAPNLNSGMTLPIENLHFPRLISSELWQEKSCPPGFPIILGSSFTWDHFRPILWKLNRPHSLHTTEHRLIGKETLHHEWGLKVARRREGGEVPLNIQYRFWGAKSHATLEFRPHSFIQGTSSPDSWRIVGPELQLPYLLVCVLWSECVEFWYLDNLEFSKDISLVVFFFSLLFILFSRFNSFAFCKRYWLLHSCTVALIGNIVWTALETDRL